MESFKQGNRSLRSRDQPLVWICPLQPNHRPVTLSQNRPQRGIPTVLVDYVHFAAVTHANYPFNCQGSANAVGGGKLPRPCPPMQSGICGCKMNAALRNLRTKKNFYERETESPVSSCVAQEDSICKGIGKGVHLCSKLDLAISADRGK